MINANREYVEMMTAALSQQTGIEIVEGDRWAASSDGKKLYFDMKDLKKLPFITTKGLVLHEIGHLKYSLPVKITDIAARHGAEMQEVYNAFEDMRIETKLTNEFGDFARQALTELDAYCVSNHIAQFSGNYTSLTKIQQFVITALFMYYSQKSYVVASCVGNFAFRMWRKGYRSSQLLIDNEVAEKFENHEEIYNTIKEIYRSNSTEDMQKLVDEKIYPLIKNWFKQNKEKEQQQQQQEQGQQGKNTGKNGQPQQQGGDPKEENKGEKLAPSQGQGGEGKNSTDIMKARAGGQGAGGESDNFSPRLNRPTEKEVVTLLNPIEFTLSQRLRDVLNDHAAQQWTGAYKRGKLLSKNAYKVGIKGETRMFSKKNNPDNPDYVVHIALDKSGSMSGSNALYAFIGAVLLKNVSERLKFKVNLYAYNHFASKIDSIEEYSDTGGGTDDEAVLEKIEQNLSKEKSNLVFIVTDGETNRTPRFKKIQAKMIKKDSIMFGIGIGGENVGKAVKKAYPNSIHVPDVQELPKKMIMAMRTVIHR